jgi:hypothetical protein
MIFNSHDESTVSKRSSFNSNYVHLARPFLISVDTFDAFVILTVRHNYGLFPMTKDILGFMFRTLIRILDTQRHLRNDPRIYHNYIVRSAVSQSRIVRLLCLRNLVRAHDFQALIRAVCQCKYHSHCLHDVSTDLKPKNVAQVVSFTINLATTYYNDHLNPRILFTTALEQCVLKLFYLTFHISDVLETYQQNESTLQFINQKYNRQLGGGGKKQYRFAELRDYAITPPDYDLENKLYFHGFYLSETGSSFSNKIAPDLLYVRVPFSELPPMLNIAQMREFAIFHGLKTPRNLKSKELCDQLATHTCTLRCPNVISVFKFLTIIPVKRTILFPPPPPNEDLIEKTITSWQDDFSFENIREVGCAVCGQLKQQAKMTNIKSIKNHLHVLIQSGVTRSERKSVREPITDVQGPVLDETCNTVCDVCRKSLREGKRPRISLANGFWLGQLPKELQELTFMEKLLIQKIRTNCCFVKVSSGMRKMVSHVIAFETPVAKVYDVLPPPPEELDEVLAILFTGPCKPTEDDFKKTKMMLVSHNRVFKALTWLKLNHPAYEDLQISMENLRKYPENLPPVSVEFKQTLGESNISPEGANKYENEMEIGTESGELPFVMHGITGDSLKNLKVEVQRAKALEHLQKGGKFLAVGHSEKSASIYDNPNLYPFPYGLGGLGMHKITHFSEKAHKKFLLNYHDKRFQTDISFRFVAFSHKQIKSATSKGFAMIESKQFDDIANRILSVDQTVLAGITERLGKGETVTPETVQEKKCFAIIRDLDHVGSGVRGSMTSKKYLRNELWSLISYLGAPSWYITFAPSDLTHPLCLYFATGNESLSPDFNITNDDRFREIIKNPVAGAKFFDFMVNMFIKHVLGVNTDHDGIFGNTSGYYGTVEQQGRLTLHLHMLLWIKGSRSPQEIRDAILDPTGEFQRKIVEYLEAVHTGDFQTGSKAEVEDMLNEREKVEGYKNPLYTLPSAPPTVECSCRKLDCNECRKIREWKQNFSQEVDDIIFRTHVHKCKSTLDKSGNRMKSKDYLGCLDNKWGTCKARFPREIFESTQVDIDTGALRLKKLEPWINTYNPVLTYLLRCNSDVTSLLSGTAIKAVVAYVSDYITKWSLNTHVIFDVIQTILTRNTELICGSATRQEKVCRLVTQMVNLLSVRMELGAPMICMYLLDKPDHYTSHKFKPFHWKSFVSEAQKFWNSEQSEQQNDDHKIILIRKNGRIFGISRVYDYIFRPIELENMSLYDWIRLCDRASIPKPNNKSKAAHPFIESDSDVQLEYESDFDEDIDLANETEEQNNMEYKDESSLPAPVGKSSLSKNMLPFVYGHLILML